MNKTVADQIAQLRGQVRANPEDHWYVTRLSSAYHEARRYALAERYAREALRLKPNCPLAKWDLAGALEMLGHRDQAMKIWRNLLRSGHRGLSHNPCNEGKEWATSLLNDTRYRLGKANAVTGRVGLAKRYLRAHLVNRQKGAKSIYSIGFVRDELSKLGNTSR